MSNNSLTYHEGKIISELDFLDDIPDDADDYEVEVFDGDEDEGCGDACKI
tara:strand:+ start:16808 stop:16957 length:150 start_codon:yes stop_codon:yes gene_type:complete